LKSKICNKIPSFTISFLFFQHFLHFVFYSTYPNLSKHYGIFLCCFIGSIRDFTNDFWKILKVLLKKLLICEFFFQNFVVYNLFFYFFIIFDILIFNFVYMYLSKNSINFLVFLFYGLKFFSKNVGKLWSIFLKNIDIRDPKFFINSFVYYLVFFFTFSYFTYPNLSKNS